MSRPQHSKAVRLRLVPVVIGLGAAVALSGCAAGLRAETSQQVASTWGANATVADISLRDVAFGWPEGEAVYPEGSTIPLTFVLVNEGLRPDRLLGVSSSYAESARISGNTVIPGGSRLYANGTEPKPPGADEGPVRKTMVEVSLVGASQPIRPGVTIPVTFDFESAGEVTLQVPIGPSPEPRPEYGSPDRAE